MKILKRVIGLIALVGAIGLFVNEEPLRSLIGLDLYYGAHQARYVIDTDGNIIITLSSIHAPARAMTAHLITSGILMAIAIGLFVWSIRTKSVSASPTPTPQR